jgi:hypothetical protein
MICARIAARVIGVRIQTLPVIFGLIRKKWRVIGLRILTNVIEIKSHTH